MKGETTKRESLVARRPWRDAAVAPSGGRIPVRLYWLPSSLGRSSTSSRFLSLIFVDDIAKMIDQNNFSDSVFSLLLFFSFFFSFFSLKKSLWRSWYREKRKWGLKFAGKLNELGFSSWVSGFQMASLALFLFLSFDRVCVTLALPRLRDFLVPLPCVISVFYFYLFFTFNAKRVNRFGFSFIGSNLIRCDFYNIIICRVTLSFYIKGEGFEPWIIMYLLFDIWLISFSL